jgi:hypothetical protein
MIAPLAITALAGAILRVEEDSSEEEEALERFRLLQAMGDPVEAWVAWLNDPRRGEAKLNAIATTAADTIVAQIGDARALEEVRDLTFHLMALLFAAEQSGIKDATKKLHNFIEIPRHFHDLVTPVQTRRVFPIFEDSAKATGQVRGRSQTPFNIWSFWSQEDQISAHTLSWDTRDPQNPRVLISLGPVVTLNLQIRPFTIPPDPTSPWGVEKFKVATSTW